MLLKSSIYPWSGYFGYLKQPHETQYDTSIFMVCDNNRTELNILITQPGSYSSAYKVASRTHFREVNIFATSYDINFVSDVYRLARDLKALGKPTVHTYFPEKFPMPVDGVTALNHIKSFTFKSRYDANISIEYHINNRDIEDRVQSGLMELPTGLIYDMVVFLGDKVVILPAKLNTSILDDCICIDKGEIHIPYSSTIYGGLSYKDIFENILKNDRITARNLLRMCYVNCFASIDEMTACKNNGNIAIARYMNKSLL
mgnify:CR=1 FL=1